MDLNHAFNWLLTNYEFVFAAVGIVLSIIKLTVWGRANAKALEAVTAAVEEVQADVVKKVVASKSGELPGTVADALKDAVATVDPAKPTPSAWQIFLREALRLRSR
jgi:hypothetical protein